MTTTVTIDKAGRIIVPKALRDALHLEAGDTLELEAEGEQMTLRPVRSGSALRKERGVWVFRRGGSAIAAETTNRVLDDIRAQRARDDRAVGE
ncbi:MAG: AbrB/MazE/SpoVT family DNA-binding domain-containing protein [Gemmatimonas sp.]|jgi:AbrB family looped-hinge helix DNA binding protein|uniref:AbrB/MazE/SpoVT family DNA-binding domain-containing protein n=1 Tax=Gemmatimonas sp. TaxID=1962908 RepID=UPI00391F4E2C|nr:AbrB/MazE/SpoVT family DNA-binding domain-containing protein [Gemmatimonadota bacterium]